MWPRDQSYELSIDSKRTARITLEIIDYYKNFDIIKILCKDSIISLLMNDFFEMDIFNYDINL